MIWLTWRQMRAQTLWTAAVLAAAAAYLLYLGTRTHDSYERNITDCPTDCPLDDVRNLFENTYGMPMLMAGMLLIAVPALIGAFWGAPLITRELETGTHRLAWNQSATRSRWLTAKLVLVGGVGVALTGALSLLLSWAAGPYDAVIDSRFEPLTFAARDLAPFGYALLAFSLGLAVGAFTRRTLVAMAVTIGVFALFQIAMGTFVRPHFAEPVTETITWAEANTVGRIDSFGISADGTGIQGYTISGAWVLDDYLPVTDATGTEITAEQVESCDGQGLGPEECLQALGASFDVTYQPADRYWVFQWLEFGTAAGLAAILTAAAYWRIRRGIN